MNFVHQNNNFEGLDNVQSFTDLAQINKQNQSSESREIQIIGPQTHQPVISHRKDQSKFIYFMVILTTLFTAFEHIIEFYLLTKTLYDPTTFTVYGFNTLKIIVNLVSIRQLRVSRSQVIGLFLMVDQILVTELTSSACLINLLYVSNGRKWYHFILMTQVAIANHYMTANFRLMTLMCKWSRGQVIAYKLTLTVVCMFYLLFGSYLLQIEFKFTKGRDPSMDQGFREWLIIYIFVQFSFSFELLAKLSDFDKSGDLKYSYELLEFNQLQEQQIVGDSNEIQNANKNLQNIS